MVIVGGGHGGAQVALALRKIGYAGTIRVIGEEQDLPYERPALSKDYLARKKPFERILLRPKAFWDERGVEFLLGRSARMVRPNSREVILENGDVLSYEALVWSAGCVPRALDCPGNALAGVHTIRNRADVDLISKQLPAARRILIVGGGYIGLEAAAVFRSLGKQVLLLENQDRLLARVSGAAVSEFFLEQHKVFGVDVRISTQVTSLVGDRNVLESAELSDGTSVQTDLAIIGIGVVPAVKPLLQAGAEGANGVHVDEFCRTSLPHVYAVGDCAAHINRFAGGDRVRIESIQNATDQALVAAQAICGIDIPYENVPWFWSNQYDIRLQTVGLSSGHDDVVIRGSPAERSFSAVYFKGGRIIALDCVNSTKDYVQGKRLVLESAIPARERIANGAIPLAEV